jgi:hypothetical protein
MRRRRSRRPRPERNARPFEAHPRRAVTRRSERAPAVGMVAEQRARADRRRGGRGRSARPRPPAPLLRWRHCAGARPPWCRPVRACRGPPPGEPASDRRADRGGELGEPAPVVPGGPHRPALPGGPRAADRGDPAAGGGPHRDDARGLRTRLGRARHRGGPSTLASIRSASRFTRSRSPSPMCSSRSFRTSGSRAAGTALPSRARRATSERAGRANGGRWRSRCRPSSCGRSGTSC